MVCLDMLAAILRYIPFERGYHQAEFLFTPCAWRFVTAQLSGGSCARRRLGANRDRRLDQTDAALTHAEDPHLSVLTSLANRDQSAHSCVDNASELVPFTSAELLELSCCSHVR